MKSIKSSQLLSMISISYPDKSQPFRLMTIKLTTAGFCKEFPFSYHTINTSSASIKIDTKWPRKLDTMYRSLNNWSLNRATIFLKNMKNLTLKILLLMKQWSMEKQFFIGKTPDIGDTQIQISPTIKAFNLTVLIMFTSSYKTIKENG